MSALGVPPRGPVLRTPLHSSKPPALCVHCRVGSAARLAKGPPHSLAWSVVGAVLAGPSPRAQLRRLGPSSGRGANTVSRQPVHPAPRPLSLRTGHPEACAAVRAAGPASACGALSESMRVLHATHRCGTVSTATTAIPFPTALSQRESPPPSHGWLDLRSGAAAHDTPLPSPARSARQLRMMATLEPVPEPCTVTPPAPARPRGRDVATDPGTVATVPAEGLAKQSRSRQTSLFSPTVSPSTVPRARGPCVGQRT